jgi:chromosomal replication initiator protein
MDNRPLTLDLVKEIIQGTTNNEPKIITMNSIKQIVSNYYGIPIDVMESKLRKHEVALARQMAMYLAKHLTQLSLKSIGINFGGRDHSTVIHAIGKVEQSIMLNTEFARKVKKIEQKISIG